MYLCTRGGESQKRKKERGWCVIAREGRGIVFRRKGAKAKREKEDGGGKDFLYQVGRGGGEGDDNRLVFFPL